MEQYMWIIWLVVFIVALIVEANTYELVSIWFAFSSVVTLIISFIPGCSWYIELIIFLILSIASILALRPFIKKFMQKEIINSNVDEYIHKRVKLIKPIKNDEDGEVKIKGIIWSAISSSNIEIEEGKEVEILTIEGNKLVVKDVE